MVWYRKGSKTNCAECGKVYVQDLTIKLSELNIEAHPDIRLICPICRKLPQYGGLFPSKGEKHD
jgi:hypothetical protein